MAPTPKKRRARKGALADISTNAPRFKPTVAKQAQKKTATKRKLAAMDLAGIAQKKMAHLPRLNMSADIRYSPSAEEYEEFRLTMGDMSKNQKFGIFRDVEDSPGKQLSSTVHSGLLILNSTYRESP